MILISYNFQLLCLLRRCMLYLCSRLCLQPIKNMTLSSIQTSMQVFQCAKLKLSSTVSLKDQKRSVFEADGGGFYGAFRLFSDNTHLAQVHMSGVISCPCASSSELCGIICSQRKHRRDHHSGSTQFNQLKEQKMSPTVFSHRPFTASGFYHQNNKMKKKIALDPDSFKYSLKNRVCIKVFS